MNPLSDSLDPRHGASIIEVLVALMVFSVAVLSLTGAGLAVSKELAYGRGYMAAAIAAQSTIDSLVSLTPAPNTGARGSQTLTDIVVSWEVVGSTPKTLVVVVARDTDAWEAVADSFYARIPD